MALGGDGALFEETPLVQGAGGAQELHNANKHAATAAMTLQVHVTAHQKTSFTTRRFFVEET